MTVGCGMPRVVSIEFLWLAVVTAVLATVGAICSYMGGYTQANAGLFKNNAAIKKTEADNQLPEAAAAEEGIDGSPAAAAY